MEPINLPDYRQLETELDSELARLERAPEPPSEVLRMAVAVAAAAQGRPRTLRSALRVARSRGVPLPTLREALLQTLLFAGYPRAINALALLADLEPQAPGPGRLDLDAEIGRDREYRDLGEALCRRVYGDRFDRLQESMARVSPELGRWMVVEGYGRVLSRPGLEVVTRELLAVAALLPLDVPDQLRAHLRGALLVGATPRAVAAAVTAASLVAPDRRDPALALLERARAASETDGES